MSEKMLATDSYCREATGFILVISLFRKDVGELYKQDFRHIKFMNKLKTLDTPESFLQKLAKVNDVEDIDLLDTDLLKQIAANPATTYEVIEILNSILKKNQSYLEAYCHHWDENYYDSLIQKLELDFGQNRRIIEKFDYISDWLEGTEEDFFSIVFSLSSITTKNVFISIAEYALKKYTENLP